MSTTTANNTMEILIQGQMENFVKTLAANGSLSEEQMAAAMAQVQQQVADLDVPAAPKRTRTKKVVAEEDRCMARVWGSGEGPQCKSAKHDGDYCKRCCKLAAVTTEPLQFAENGKHLGLFWGRMDQPQPVFSSGFLCVQWKSDESKAIVDAAIKEGKTWHKFSNEGGKKKKSGGSKKPRKSKKSSKKSISSSVPRSKNAYMYFLGEKRAEVRAALLAESDDGKVAVSEVAKKVGAMWKALDDAGKAPYTELAAAAKAERDAKIAELVEAASQASESDDESVAESLEASVEDAALLSSIAKPAPKGAIKVSEFDLKDPITAACFKGVTDNDSVEDDSSVISGVTEASVEGDDDEEMVDEHDLADGTTVLKGADGTLYNPESFDAIGKWNEADNTLISA
jgi:hypothetical protein